METRLKLLNYFVHKNSGKITEELNRIIHVNKITYYVKIEIRERSKGIGY